MGYKYLFSKYNIFYILVTYKYIEKENSSLVL